MNVTSIEKALPILGFNNDFLISNNLDMGFGLQLQLPELLSCSRERLYSLQDTFQRIVNLLPPGSLLHKQDFFLADQFDSMQTGKIQTGESDPTKPGLDQCYRNHFRGRPFLRHECYLYISLLNTGLLKNYLASSLIFSKKVHRQEIRITEKLRELQTNLSVLFTQDGIHCEPVSREEAIGDENSPGLIERYLSLNFGGETPVLGGIDFRDRLRVMDQFVEILSLSDYSHLPSELNPVSSHPHPGSTGNQSLS